MGWQIEVKEKEGKETKYRIWTTVSDGWLTKWSTKEEILKFLFWHRIESCIQTFIEDSMTFPHNWGTKDMKRMQVDSEKVDEFYKFMNDAFKYEDKQYTEVYAEKFKEIIKGLGIEITIKDSDGYSL